MGWATIKKYTPPFSHQEYERVGYRRDVAAGRGILAQFKSFGTFMYDISIPAILLAYAVGTLSTGNMNPVEIHQILKQRQQISLEKVLEESKAKINQKLKE